MIGIFKEMGQMNKKIGVYLSEIGETIPLNKSGVIRVYAKEDSHWGITKVIEFDMSNVMSIQSIRDKFKELAPSLEDCKILVASNITGIPYNVLDSMGFNLWEIEGKPEMFLDYVLEKELSEEQEEKEETKVVGPIETNKAGHFFINLKELQQNNSKLSSKQVLMPFLKSTNFYELEIICGHTPPWFKNEFEKMNLKYFAVENSNNEHRIKVYHRTCNEG